MQFRLPTLNGRQPVKIMGIMIISMLLTVKLIAASAETGRGDFTGKNVGLGIYDIYRTIRNISLPLAAVGVSASGIQIMITSPENAAKARHRILIILMAVGAMLLIPTVIKLGESIAAGLVWNPPD